MMAAMQLTEAFALGPGAVVAAVGGGGKTSLVFALAEAAAESGGAAVVTTTTKMTRPQRAQVDDEFEYRDAAAPLPMLRTGAVLFLHAGRGSRGRYLGVDGEAVAAIAARGADLLAVEADGSGGHPFKAPAAHEPVIPACVTDVIVCVGLDALGQPLDEAHVHRAERVAALGRAAASEPIGADLIVRVLSAEEGGRKGTPPDARLHALLNAPSDDERLRLGQHIGQRLVYGGFHRAVVATAHEQRVHAVVR